MLRRFVPVVCLVPGLASGMTVNDLDEMVARYVAGAAETLSENAACVKSDQQRWQREVRDRCADDTCRERVRLERLAELAELQAGLTAPKSLGLPRRAALAWTIAPETDPYMVPRVRASNPARIEGTFAYSESDGGYVVRDAAGAAYLLVMDAALGGSTASALQSLAKTAQGSRFAASGRLARDDRGKPFFDRRSCIYLYRLPR